VKPKRSSPAAPPQALILAGGSGTRFWPLSRRRRPKQFLALDGEATLLQATLQRLQPLVEPSAVWVCTTAALCREVARQLPEVPRRQILAEPEGRNTAAAIAWSLSRMPARLRDAPIVVLPADHRVADPAAFRLRLGQAIEAVRERDLVVTLGVVPRWPETGYGYLRLGRTLDERSGLRRVSRFTEKPDLARARRFVRSGAYLWNAGIFVFRAATVLREVERHLPELHAGLRKMGRERLRVARLYGTLPAVSIDVGLMEKLSIVATLPLDCGWSDLGSWAALQEVRPQDDRGNAIVGEVVALDASRNLLFADSGLVAVLGVEGLAVVRSRDSVLVVPLERSQEVRRILAELEARGHAVLL